MNSSDIQSSDSHVQAKPVSRLPIWRRILKITAWTFLALVLLLAGLLMGTLSILRPDRLTPIVNSVANNNLNADVTIDRVELSMSGSFPYLRLNVDGVTVLSRDTRALDSDERQFMPQWVDTLLTVKHISGGINVVKILKNDLQLQDLRIDTPCANLAIVNDSITNFNIFKPSQDTTAFNFADLPDIQVNRFEIVNPGPVRYYDFASSTDVTARFKDISLIGSNAPVYQLIFEGDVDNIAELVAPLDINDLQFGLTGGIRWEQSKPYNIGFNDFTFGLGVVKGVFAADIDFTDQLVVKSFDFKLQPLSLAQTADFVQSLSTQDEDGEGTVAAPVLDTDAKYTVSGTLTEPYVAAEQMLPRLKITVDIPTSYLKWQDLNLREFAANLVLDIPSDDLSEATVTVNKLDMVGPATDLHLKGTFRDLLGDTYFDADVNTDTDLNKLPTALKSLFGGSIQGNVRARATLKGRVSMFAPSGFQNLIVQGDVGLRDIYWVSGDTVNMVYVDRALFKFDSQRRFNTPGGRSHPLLSAEIKVDSCAVEHGTYIFRIRDLGLGLATKATFNTDTTAVHPMGGGLKVGYFNFTSITDSATVRLRNVKGLTIVRAMDGDLHRPALTFRLHLDRLSAGDNSTRMMVSNADLTFDTSKKPASRRQQRLRHIADSLKTVYPELPPDSIYAWAVRQHNLHRRPYPRVHPEVVDQETEIIDWGASKGFKRWLNGWKISGRLTSDRARLFTPYFPLRNRVRNIDVTFNNDTLKITNLQYKAGHSDMTLSGKVTNIRRAITSRNGRRPIKIRFESLSDTIDVNQLTASVFAGAAYSDARARGHSVSLSQIDDESRLDSIISNRTTATSDSAGPLLIPTNVDLEVKVKADNVLYSDLLLHNLRGDLLAYGGALNLHDLSASSNVGSVGLSALYMGHDIDKLSFGFGVQLNNFNISRFLQLVPAIDSIMPVLKDFSGIVSAEIAATSPVTKDMELELDRIDAAIEISGDSLVLIDPDTFKSLSKWLFFKDKKRNIIDHMAMQMTVREGLLRVYPFIFDIDRYRLGVQGYNDFALNFNYHIAVLKSPIPFKFGINISGDPDKFKVRLGGAKFKQVESAQAMFVDKARVSLLKQIQGVFVRGVRGARMSSLKLDSVPAASTIDLGNDVLTPADSARLIQEGMLPAPPPQVSGQKDKKGKKHKKQQ